MKKLLLLLLIFCMPLIAEEIWLGLAVGAEGDSLILVDNLKIYVPGLSLGKYIGEDNQAISVSAVKFPFTASLVRITQGTALPTDETAPIEVKHLVNTYVRIHKFYNVVNGRLVEK